MSGLSWSYGTKCGLQALRRAPMPLATGFRFSAISSSEPFRVSRRAAAVRRLTPPERLALGTPTAQLPIVHYFSVQIDGRMHSLAIRLAHKGNIGSVASRHRRAGNGVALPMKRRGLS